MAKARAVLAVFSLALGLGLLPRPAVSQCPSVCACIGATMTIDCSPVAGIDERLTVIPPGGPPDFTTLIMTDNHLSTLLSGNFSAYPALETLVLDNNLLSSIPSDGLDSLPQLMSLSLDGNPLTELGSGVFSNLSSLQTLSIRYTPLTAISGGAFIGQGGLQQLTLDDNSLNSLSVDFFTHIPSIQMSALRNDLATLPDGILDQLDQSARLDLRENPWSCDCRMQWIADDLDLYPDLLVMDSETVCLWPPALINQPISSVDASSFTCYAPSVVREPEDAYVLTTTQFTLLCDVDGAPFPTITWMKDGQTLNLTERVYRDTYNGSLRFASIELEDAGEYQCFAANSNGSAQSVIATLTVDEITCFDGRESDHETDVDCGGQFCVPCNITQGCGQDSDCVGDLVCLHAHQLPSSLPYVSPNSSIAFTCALPSTPVALLEEGLLSSLPFAANINGSSDASQIRSSLQELIAQQLNVPVPTITIVDVTSVERFGPPLYQVYFDLPRSSPGDQARDELRRQIDDGSLKATVRITEDSGAHHVRMNLADIN